MPREVKFSVSTPRADRVHHVNEADVRIVLSRLPVELWRRLRAVHFNDQSRGGRVFGYVNRGRREIALCALPPRMSLTRSLAKGWTPEQFGATPGRKWPALAIRRFLLYDVFLHELGHLQMVNGRAQRNRLRFAREKLAHDFATEWCSRLWSERFDHPDPVHNPPKPEELAYSPRLQTILEESRRQIREGEVLTHYEFWAEIEAERAQDGRRNRKPSRANR